MNTDAIDSASWYDRNVDDYVERTESVDLFHLHQRFVAYIPDRGRILDAGCGSGRDTQAFIAMGYDVVPMDASIEMVRRVEQKTGRTARRLRHQEVAFVEEFDGVWSMASLLHVPHSELPEVLRRYQRALVPGGVLFASFKHGTGEEYRSERLFANQHAGSFPSVVGQVSGLQLIEMWVEPDRRPGRQEEWFSVLCRRSR